MFDNNQLFNIKNRDLLVEQLIVDNPYFHFKNGKPENWSIQPDTLRYISKFLHEGMTTLETGCGQSTVLFAIAGTNHTCITIDQGEADRVYKYCKTLGISPNITFLVGSSAFILPSSDQIPKHLDYVFIDGGHAFPAAVIDWYFTASRLRVDGIMSIDDFKMPSVKILIDVLCVEEEWKFEEIVQNTIYFRKLKELKDLAYWSGQKINEDFV